VANLLRPLLLVYAERLEEPPERLLVSGLLTGEVDEVAGAFARRGMREAQRRERGDWASALLSRWS
jgi:ribosomal protein L11 methyltransferase